MTKKDIAIAFQQSENLPPKKTMPTLKLANAEEYIKNCPKEVRGKLTKIRTAIQQATPGSTECTDN